MASNVRMKASDPFAPIMASPDIEEKCKTLICLALSRKRWSPQDVLRQPEASVATILPGHGNAAALKELLEWRRIELWKVHNLPDAARVVHSACKTGNYGAVETVVTSKQLPNVKKCQKYFANHVDEGNHKRSPLFDAAIGGFPVIVRRLIELGADLEAKDDTGSLCVHIAADGGRVNCLKQIIDKNPELRHAPDKHQNTPLNRAASSGQLGVLEMLLDGDLTQRVYVDNYDIGGRTALLQAAANGHAKVVKYLIANGANLFATEFTATNSAAHLAAMNGHDQVLLALMESCPEVKKFENIMGETPIDLATKNHHQSAVDVLNSNVGNGDEQINGSISPSRNSSLPIPAPRLIDEHPIVRTPDGMFDGLDA